MALNAINTPITKNQKPVTIANQSNRELQRVCITGFYRNVSFLEVFLLERDIQTSAVLLIGLCEKDITHTATTERIGGMIK